MPLHTESLPTYSPEDFCLAMKRARERKGITLAEIANATKIPAYLFAGLERNDLRRWPKGLFRRSFFRDYARMIGVPLAESCAEFVRLFPDDAGAELTKPPPSAGEADPESDLRLALDPEWHGPRASILLKLLAASIDAAVVILIAAALARVGGFGQPAVTAIVALAYFSLATAIFGENPAKWAISRREAIARVFQSLAAASTPEPAHDTEERSWITDAHRVGPSRLRVRIKVS